MNRRFLVPVFTAALGLVIFQAQGQTPPPSADPYANNSDAGKLKFPLAAPAGKDSGAITKAFAGAVNQGMLDLRQQGVRFDASGLPEKSSMEAKASEQIAPATPAPSPAPPRGFYGRAL
jgi:hypothetical protein